MDIGGSSPSGLSQAAVEALIGSPPINVAAGGLGERLYGHTPSGQMPVASCSLVNNTLYATPIWIPRRVTIDQLSIKVTALWAGSTFYLGLYANTSVNVVYPSTRLAISGALSSAAIGWIDYAIGAPIIVDAGTYWFVMNASSSAATFSAVTCQYNREWAPPLGLSKTEYDAGSPWRQQLTVAMVYAQPPTPFPAGAVPVNVTTIPLFCYRRSA